MLGSFTMKWLLPPLLLLLSLLSGTGICNASPQPLTVMVKNNELSIANTVINPNWSMREVLAKLGNADRERDSYNKAYTYDSKGIVIFERSINKTIEANIIEIQFHFSVLTPSEITPRGNFSGKLVIDETTCTSSLTAEEMLKKFLQKKWKITESYIKHNYRIYKGGIYIYFQFDDSENKLLNVSIGPVKN